MFIFIFVLEIEMVNKIPYDFYKKQRKLNERTKLNVKTFSTVEIRAAKGILTGIW